jgi:hypothetical protein
MRQGTIQTITTIPPRSPEKNIPAIATNDFQKLQILARNRASQAISIQDQTRITLYILQFSLKPNKQSSFLL